MMILCAGSKAFNRNTLSKRPSKQLFKCLLKEAPDYLIKSLAELALNASEDVIPLKKEGRHLVKDHSKYLNQLGRKGGSLKLKRKSMLSRGYPVLPQLIKVSKNSLKSLATSWLEEW